MINRRIPWKTLLLGAALAIPALVGLAQEGTPNGEVKWRYDYKLAIKEAKDKNLPLVIDFGTKSCRYCVLLDQTTFRDSRVVGALNDRFIPLKIDAEVEVELSNFLRITSYPTIILAGPDLKILHTIVGYKEAGEFHESLQRILASVTSPDWMQRDLQKAKKMLESGNFAGAIATLRTINEDPKGWPVQASAEKLMNDLELKASERLAKAKELHGRGQYSEAIEVLTETLRIYPGLQVSREASEMVTKIVQSPEIRNQQRGKRARELLVQAKDFYKNREFIPCLDRCEVLAASYGDMQEGQEALLIVNEIKGNPEWLLTAAETMSDRLGAIWLGLADSHLKKSQPQQAEMYLQRVIQAFPGSRQAESAQIRISQLQGLPARTAEPP